MGCLIKYRTRHHQARSRAGIIHHDQWKAFPKTKDQCFSWQWIYEYKNEKYKKNKGKKTGLLQQRAADGVALKTGEWDRGYVFRSMDSGGTIQELSHALTAAGNYRHTHDPVTFHIDLLWICVLFISVSNIARFVTLFLYDQQQWHLRTRSPPVAGMTDSWC